MKELALIFILFVTIGLSSCKVLVLDLGIADQPPVTQDLSIVPSLQNIEKIVALAYLHPDEELATSCELTHLVNVIQTTPCSCDLDGVCSVGLTGLATGVATFNYFVTVNNQRSNSSIGILFVTNSAPVAASLVADTEYRMIEKMWTLNYTDTEGDLATACTVSNLANVIQTTACACDGLGVCSVGIIGETQYTGVASFDYKVSTSGVESNTATVTFTIHQIGAPLNDEWIKVPANAGGMGLNEFYVMKHEARAWMKKDPGAIANENNIIDAGEVDADGLNGAIDNWVEALDPNAAEGDPTDYLPVSVASSQPWRRIDAYKAALRCQSLGANYQLISNEHWMAIARDIENRPENWTGGAVGVGCLFRGNSGEVTVGDGTGLGDSCGYDSITDPASGTSRDLRAIHTLSNGAQIYDFAGNIAEWVDWDKASIDFQVGPIDCLPDGTWEELSLISCASLLDDDYLPTIGTYTSVDGIGQFSGGTGGAARRGGYWSTSSLAGLFAVNFGYDPSDLNHQIGFRCVFVPSS